MPIRGLDFTDSDFLGTSIWPFSVTVIHANKAYFPFSILLRSILQDIWAFFRNRLV